MKFILVNLQVNTFYEVVVCKKRNNGTTGQALKNKSMQEQARTTRNDLEHLETILNKWNKTKPPALWTINDIGRHSKAFDSI